MEGRDGFMKPVKISLFMFDGSGAPQYTEVVELLSEKIEGVYKTCHENIWNVKLFRGYNTDPPTQYPLYTTTANIIRIFEAVLPA